MEWLQRRILAVTANNSKFNSAVNYAQSSLPRSFSGGHEKNTGEYTRLMTSSHSSPTSPLSFRGQTVSEIIPDLHNQKVSSLFYFWQNGHA